MKKRLVVGISGGSGIPLATELLSQLQKIEEIETHLVYTRGAEVTAAQESELSMEEICALADVTLKERRKLILVARECPFNTIHLRNLYELSQIGVEILPPMLTYYNHPQTVADCTRHIVGNILDRFDVEGEDFRRWNGCL